jgi:hypothetical protein
MVNAVVEWVMEKLFHKYRPYPLKRSGRVTTPPRLLVIRASAAATSTGPAVVEGAVLTERGAFPWVLPAVVIAFAMGFVGFLRSFVGPAGTFLACDFDAAAAFAAAANCFCNFHSFLRCSAANDLFCFSYSF